VAVTSAEGEELLSGREHRDVDPKLAPWKVNFCKFINPTRNGIEDAVRTRPHLNRGGHRRHCRLRLRAGLACKTILLVDDNHSIVRDSAVSDTAWVPAGNLWSRDGERS
jgi:hypothetical protein